MGRDIRDLRFVDDDAWLIEHAAHASEPRRAARTAALTEMSAPRHDGGGPEMFELTAALPLATAQETHALDKTRLCKFFRRGQCTRGEACTFAHGKRQLRAQPDLYRTQPCIDFAKTGSCSFGAGCRYAHSADEMRPSDLLKPLKLPMTRRGRGGSGSSGSGVPTHEADSTIPAELGAACGAPPAFPPGISQAYLERVHRAARSMQTPTEDTAAACLSYRGPQMPSCCATPAPAAAQPIEVPKLCLAGGSLGWSRRTTAESTDGGCSSESPEGCSFRGPVDAHYPWLEDEAAVRAATHAAARMALFELAPALAAAAKRGGGRAPAAQW